MSSLRAGLVSGLIAVLVTSVLNIIGRALGMLPEQLDLKRMAFWVSDPTTAFWVGLILHILGGMLVGVVFVLLIKRPTPLKGIGFSLLLVWLSMMLLIFPITGRGFFGANIGIVMPIATFVLNIVYGLIAGMFAQRLVINLDNEFTVTLGKR